ncbi:hypothetical protein [Streptomyces sp. NPDC052701]|uniref:hypothetical protein n=1 Tax=Streptomyces sp. NPDC052701 TaxID=3155533 RepID=UPI0034203A32
MGEPGPAAGESVPLVHSGGADGRVRAWRPGNDPLTVPMGERRCPISALAAAMTTTGLALAVVRADGLVPYRRPDAHEERAFRPGAPVDALALSGTEEWLIGTDGSLIRLRPR